MQSESPVVPIHPTILHWQEAMIRQFGKDQGMAPGISEPLRRILTEWRNLRAEKDGITPEQMLEIAA